MPRKKCPKVAIEGAPCALCAQKDRLELMAKVLGWATALLAVVVVGSLAYRYWPIG